MGKSESSELLKRVEAVLYLALLHRDYSSLGPLLDDVKKYNQAEQSADARFGGIFEDAIEGLTEYHPVLNDEAALADIRAITLERFVDSGNTQADYEMVRDLIELAICEKPNLIHKPERSPSPGM